MPVLSPLGHLPLGPLLQADRFEELEPEPLEQDERQRLADLHLVDDEQSLLCQEVVDHELAVERAEPVVGDEEDRRVGPGLFKELRDHLVLLPIEIKHFVHHGRVELPGGLEFLPLDRVEVVPHRVHHPIGLGEAREAQFPIGILIHEMEAVPGALPLAVDLIVDELLGVRSRVALPVDGDGVLAEFWFESLHEIARPGKVAVLVRREHVGEQHAFDLARGVTHRHVHDDARLPCFGEDLPERLAVHLARVDDAAADLNLVVGLGGLEEIEDAVVARLLARGEGDPRRPGDGGNGAHQRAPGATLHERLAGGHDALLGQRLHDVVRHAVEADDHDSRPVAHPVIVGGEGHALGGRRPAGAEVERTHLRACLPRCRAPCSQCFSPSTSSYKSTS